MKIRMGFVSNSSSSSFCILGIKGRSDAIYNLMVAEGFPVDEGGRFLNSSQIVDGRRIYDGYGFVSLVTPNGIYGGEKICKLSYYGTIYNKEPPMVAGFDAEEYLKDKSITQAVQEFVKFCKGLGVDIPEKWVGLYFGESGSE
jgi:hypothetical protein